MGRDPLADAAAVARTLGAASKVGDGALVVDAGGAGLHSSVEGSKYGVSSLTCRGTISPSGRSICGNSTAFQMKEKPS